MKRLMALIFFAANLASGAPASPTLIANVQARTTISLNGTWHVIVDPYETGLSSRYYENRKPKDQQELVEYDFDAAGTLQVPGDWNSQRESLLFYEGPVWYERSFAYHRNEPGRTFLYFGAANYLARVYLNGKSIGEHQGGFTPFNFEVTDAVRDGENFVVVEVNNTRRADAVPGLNTDWWNYGGLTRDVSVVDVPKTFIQDYFVQLAKDSPGEIAGWVKLNGTTETEQVTLEIPEANIAQRASTDGNGYAEFKFTAKVHPWSPEDPKLYRVLIAGAGDRVKDSIGFRTIETRGTRILLNGKPIFLRGISIHEEAAFRGGRAFLTEDDAVLLDWARELGCNFVRLAHYPHNENMIRLADQMGFLVWEEIPVYWDIDWKNPGTLQAAEEQMRDLIARDHNRAAAIFWSVGNETPINAPRLDFLKQLASYTREQDSTRLLTAAMNHTEKSGADTRVSNDPLGEFLDVLGLNEYVGWYDGSIATADGLQWKSAYDKPLIISEFGAETPYGAHGSADTRWTEEYQTSVYRHQIAMLRKIPSLAGMSPWVLMDFRSPRRPLAGVQDFYNRKGLISDRGQRKQAFYILQGFYREAATAPPDGSSAVTVLLSKSDSLQVSTSGTTISVRQLSVPAKAQERFANGQKLLREDAQQAKAILEFERAIQLFPSYYEAYAAIAVADYQLNKLQDSETALRKAIDLSSSKYPAALILLAEVCNDQGRFEEAEPLARQATELDDSSWHAHFALARALVGLSRGEEAEMSAEKSRDLKPDNSQVLLVLANAHILEHEYSAAVQDLDAYLKLEPEGTQSDGVRQRRDRIRKALQDAATPDPDEQP